MSEKLTIQGAELSGCRTVNEAGEAIMGLSRDNDDDSDEQSTNGDSACDEYESSDTDESGRSGSSRSGIFDSDNCCQTTVDEARKQIGRAINNLEKAEAELETARNEEKRALARRRKRRRANHRRNVEKRRRALYLQHKMYNNHESDISDHCEMDCPPYPEAITEHRRVRRAGEQAEVILGPSSPRDIDYSVLGWDVDNEFGDWSGSPDSKYRRLE